MEIGYLEIFFLLFSIPLIFQYLYVNYLFKTSKVIFFLFLLYINLKLIMNNRTENINLI